MDFPSNPPQWQPQPMGMPPGPGADDTNQIEDLIEAVIEEKWKEVEKNISKVLSWKDKTEQRLTQMDQAIADMRQEFSGLQNAIIGKVGEYDKNVLGVSSQLKAMEKAFSQILPKFIENINELDRITQDMKR